MKIRHGFVSNSSSSSFIVGFPRRPKSVDELQKMLFGDEKVYVGPYDSHQYDAQTIAQIVWNDLQGQKPLNINKTAMIVECGYTNGKPSMDSFHDEKDKIDWDKYEEATKKFAREHAKEFADAHPRTVMFSFEYSDNEGEMYTAMEHGTLFDRLPHLRISHH